MSGWISGIGTRAFKCYYLVPIRMHGEGSYQLTSVKDVQVTQEFLSLNIKDRKCQHDTTLDGCRTKMYLAKMRNICHCFPFSIWTQEKVFFVEYSLNLNRLVIRLIRHQK